VKPRGEEEEVRLEEEKEGVGMEEWDSFEGMTQNSKPRKRFRFRDVQEESRTGLFTITQDSHRGN
jgi:hypothetical protein